MLRIYNLKPFFSKIQSFIFKPQLNIQNQNPPIKIRNLFFGSIIFGCFFTNEQNNKILQANRDLINKTRFNKISIEEKKLEIIKAKFNIIKKIYDIFNGQQVYPSKDILCLIRNYLLFELNHLFIDRTKFNNGDLYKLDSIIDSLTTIYNYIKNDITFIFNINNIIYINDSYNITTYFGLQNNKNNNKYTKAAKYIYEYIKCSNFFLKLYFLNKKYQFMPDYIIICILDQYLYWALNKEEDILFLNINYDKFYAKYKFAYLILHDFTNINIIGTNFKKNELCILFCKQKYFDSPKQFISGIKKYYSNEINMQFIFVYNKNPNNRLNYFYYNVFYKYINS